jgi:putative membrane protein
MMWWAQDGWNWWAWVVMSLGMVAFWALVVWAVVSLIHSPRGSGARPNDARAILDERPARGEVDEIEYRARLDALRDTRPHSTPHPGQ